MGAAGPARYLCARGASETTPLLLTFISFGPDDDALPWPLRFFAGFVTAEALGLGAMAFASAAGEATTGSGAGVGAGGGTATTATAGGALAAAEARTGPLPARTTTAASAATVSAPAPNASHRARSPLRFGGAPKSDAPLRAESIATAGGGELGMSRARAA